MLRHILVAAVVAAAMTHAAALAQPATQPSVESVITGADDIFPISFWCGPQRNFVNVERYQQVKEAGFTFIMPDCCGGNEPELQQRILDTAAKVGLKAFVDDQRMPHGVTTDEQRKNLDTIVADYSKHPALAGYFVGDEPRAEKFPAIAQVFAYLHEKDPKHPAYINLMPNWATPEQLASADYETYVSSFVEIVKPRILSYDHYRFFTKSDRPGYFANIDVLRANALRANIPFWQIIQATSHGDYRRLTEAEKRHEAFNALAYGAKGVLYFTYWQPDADPIWDEAIIALDGTPTRQYEEVTRNNHDLQIVGRELMRATSLGVLQQGRPGDQTNVVDAIPVDFNQPDITIGYFAAGEKHLALFVNRDYRNPVETSVSLAASGAGAEVLDRATGKWHSAESTSADLKTWVTLKLDAGDAVLYRW